LTHVNPRTHTATPVPVWALKPAVLARSLLSCPILYLSVLDHANPLTHVNPRTHTATAVPVWALKTSLIPRWLRPELPVHLLTSWVGDLVSDLYYRLGFSSSRDPASDQHYSFSTPICFTLSCNDAHTQSQPVQGGLHIAFI